MGTADFAGGFTNEGGHEGGERSRSRNSGERMEL